MGLSASTITHLLSVMGGGNMTRGILVVTGLGAATGAAATKGCEAVIDKIKEKKSH